jgi:hypothetical protein
MFCILSAASLAHGLDKKTEDKQNILIFNLDSGFFNALLFSRSSHILAVSALFASILGTLSVLICSDPSWAQYKCIDIYTSITCAVLKGSARIFSALL